MKYDLTKLSRRSFVTLSAMTAMTACLGGCSQDSNPRESDSLKTIDSIDVFSDAQPDELRIVKHEDGLLIPSDVCKWFLLTDVEVDDMTLAFEVSMPTSDAVRFDPNIWNLSGKFDYWSKFLESYAENDTAHKIFELDDPKASVISNRQVMKILNPVATVSMMDYSISSFDSAQIANRDTGVVTGSATFTDGYEPSDAPLFSKFVAMGFSQRDWNDHELFVYEKTNAIYVSLMSDDEADTQEMVKIVKSTLESIELVKTLTESKYAPVLSYTAAREKSGLVK